MFLERTFATSLELLPMAGKEVHGPETIQLLGHAELLPAYWRHARDILKAADALVVLAEAEG